MQKWVWSLSWEDPWKRAQQPTPVFLPGESHGHRSLTGYGPKCSKLLLFNPIKEKAVAPHSRLLPGKSHGWRSLVGCSPWGCQMSDTTKVTEHTRMHIYMYVCIWLLHATCGILVPRPKLSPASPAVEMQRFNHWTTREHPAVILF